MFERAEIFIATDPEIVIKAWQPSRFAVERDVAVQDLLLVYSTLMMIVYVSILPRHHA